MEYNSDASNDGLLLSALKSDGNFDSAERLDGAAPEVVHLDEPQPCPICKITLPRELGLVNQHIDECLNRFRNSYENFQNMSVTISAAVTKNNEYGFM